MQFCCTGGSLKCHFFVYSMGVALGNGGGSQKRNSFVWEGLENVILLYGMCLQKSHFRSGGVTKTPYFCMGVLKMQF